MKKILNTIVSVLALTALLSCETDYGEFNRDNRPEIPLQFLNTTSFGHDPYIEISESGPGDIVFEMQIPENSGRTIREISRVAAGLTALNPGALNTEENYITAPVPGEGNRVTFQTTLEEFKAKRPEAEYTIPEGGYGEIAFIFLVTLDNGETIVSMRARARISE